METRVIDLNKLIMDAMKAHDTVRTETLRAIKTAFMNWQTSKEHAGKELTYADSMQIIKKMVKQREESIEQYVTAGRQELADAEQAQIDVLKHLDDDNYEISYDKKYAFDDKLLEEVVSISS